MALIQTPLTVQNYEQSLNLESQSPTLAMVSKCYKNAIVKAYSVFSFRKRLVTLE